MGNKKNNKANNFIKNEVLKLERNSFAVSIIVTGIGYAGITWWLNSIRATAALWFVWVLIIIQFALYFSIFIKSHNRATTCGLNKNISIVLFIVLAVLGRVNDWELVVIPLTIIVMLIFSAKTKKVSDNKKHLLPQHNAEEN